MKEISNEEKIELESEAVDSFLEQFKPYDDDYSVLVLETLFDVLLQKQRKSDI